MILNMRDNEIREEGREEGLKEGRRDGMMETLVDLVKEKLLDITDAARRANMTPDEFAKAAGIKS